jgi:fucose 4-O-acetylase-like acetyltransferase
MAVKIQWVDTWKGIGILAVVVGHIIDSAIAKYIFWFHIPLFFFISGYLYKGESDYGLFFKKKFCTLIVPYISFLILFSLPEYLDFIHQFMRGADNQLIHELLQITFDRIYGGRNLYGWFGVFWFITCLFFTQQVYNLLHCQAFKYRNAGYLLAGAILIAYIMAMLDTWFFKGVKFPWSIDAVAIALPFYYLGHLSRQHSIPLSCRSILLVSLLILGCAIALDLTLDLGWYFNIKTQRYGVIGINLLIALAGICITHGLAKVADRINYLGRAFSWLGQASLMIMYLHQLIQITLQYHPNFNQQSFRIIAALLMPLIAYQFSLKFELTRRMFLGDFRYFAEKPRISPR